MSLDRVSLRSALREAHLGRKALRRHTAADLSAAVFIAVFLVAAGRGLQAPKHFLA